MLRLARATVRPNITTMQTKIIKNIKYIVVDRVETSFKGRFSLYLKRPKGKRLHLAVEYENGAISDVVSLKFFTPEKYEN